MGDRAAQELLAALCADLRLLREQAGGPTLREMERRTGMSKSQLGAILSGRIRRLPDWSVVLALVEGAHEFAQARERVDRLSLRTGVDEYWRPRYTALEFAFDAADRNHVTDRYQAGSPVSPAGGLPPALASFTGRDGEIDAIAAAVDAAAAAGLVVSIHAIDGMPGVGKTALAVQVAHRMARRFEDPPTFVDLHGHTAGQQPVDTGEVLAGLLVADGVDARSLPDDTAARSALWRQRMASRRRLLVLDNAVSSDQVAPLLPTSPGCAVLVTSRRFLGDLPTDVVSLPLDVLSAAEAKQMFLRLAPRAAVDPVGVARLVAVLGYLPLAISLMARVLTRHRIWTVADLLTEAQAQMLVVTAENNTVAAAFDLSYRNLPARRRWLFRHLGLHPGAEVDPYGAAALAGMSYAEAVRHLRALHDDNLLIEIGYRRYRMHDLIRGYTRGLATDALTAQQQAQARNRLFDYYRYAVSLAGPRVARQSDPAAPSTVAGQPGPVVPDLDDPAEALAWLRMERDNLLACLPLADDAGRVELTGALAEIVRRDGHLNEAIALYEAAIGATERLGDRLSLANALAVRGDLLRTSADYSAAERDLHRAFDLYRDLDNRVGQANALTNLGKTWCATDDYVQAADALGTASDLYRDLGDRLGQAHALTFLGDMQRLTGDFAAAVRTLREALRLHRDLQERMGQANDLLCLGVAYRSIGNHAEADAALEQASALFKDLGNPIGQANAVHSLAHSRYRRNDNAGAIRDAQEALDLYRDYDDRRGQANALKTIGYASLASDSRSAEQALRDALEIFRELRDRSGEAETLNAFGALHRASGDLSRAVASHRRALELCRQIGSAWDEAESLTGLGRCEVVAGRTSEGIDLLRAALAIFSRIGAVEAAELTVEIAALTGTVVDACAHG